MLVQDRAYGRVIVRSERRRSYTVGDRNEAVRCGADDPHDAGKGVHELTVAKGRH